MLPNDNVTARRLDAELRERGLSLSDAQRATLQVLEFSMHIELVDASEHGQVDGHARLELQLDYGRSDSLAELTIDGGLVSS